MKSLRPLPQGGGRGPGNQFVTPTLDHRTRVCSFQFTSLSECPHTQRLRFPGRATKLERKAQAKQLMSFVPSYENSVFYLHKLLGEHLVRSMFDFCRRFFSRSHVERVACWSRAASPAQTNGRCVERHDATSTDVMSKNAASLKLAFPSSSKSTLTAV